MAIFHRKWSQQPVRDRAKLWDSKQKIWGLLDVTWFTSSTTLWESWCNRYERADSIQATQICLTMILGPICEISYPAPTNIRIDPSKWIEAWVFAHQTVCDWNGLHQIKTGNLICGFPKMGASNMWISRGIATPLRWDLRFPTNNGSLHFSYGFPIVFLWFSDVFFPHISPGISRDLLVPHLVLRCLTKGHQLAPGDQEAIRRQDTMTNMLPGRIVEGSLEVKLDRWKAEQGRGRENRKIRREKIREGRCRCAKR